MSSIQRDEDKTKDQLINELMVLRRRIAALEVLEIERKQAQKALLESDVRYRDLFKGASDAIFIADLKGNIVEANQAAVALLGYSMDQLVGMNLQELFTAESLEVARQRLKRRIKGETINERCEYQVVRKDGIQAIIESTASIISVKGQPIGFHMVARDVTEERRLRQGMQFYITEVTRAQENERNRIARELHDETAQHLATLALDIDAITRVTGLSEEIMKRLDELRERTEKAMEEVRRFSYDLRPGVLDHLGLLPALEWLADETSTRSGIHAHVAIIGTQRRLSPEVELVVFRIAQEALSNVRKHSNATKAVVTIEFAPEKARLDVTDNGRGFKMAEITGEFASVGKLGIDGMRERSRLIDGRFLVESEAGKGTTVAVEVVG